jgi:hypothetical protein
MASSYKKSFDVKDDECLLWIRDPSFSPFEKEIELRFNRVHKYRREILDDENQKNPKDILNKIKRRCFYNSALRPQIIQQIIEYQSNNTLRLYPYDGYFTYSEEPFTKEQCKEWANNHLVNPRTGHSIRMDSTTYMELLYTTLQYRLPTPPVLNNNPDDEIDKILYIYINKVIKNVKKRLEFMEKMDDYFLNNSIGTIDLPSNVRKKNTFSVSTSSNKSLNSGEKRKIMDRMLENEEQEKLVNEYQHSRFSQRQITQQARITRNTSLFTSLQTFLTTLSNEVEKGTLIRNIVSSYTLVEKEEIINAIQEYFEENEIEPANQKDYFNGFFPRANITNFANIIKQYIRNIYSQLLDPSIKSTFKIEYLSYYNNITYFEQTKLSLNIAEHLFSFMSEYRPKLDDRLYRYISNIIDDDLIIQKNETYRNEYYKLLIDIKIRQQGEQLRLPAGMGLLTDITINQRLVVDNNLKNDFTYEECKTWVKMPIFNPRTFKPIKIDSPLYNRLLCMSFQYDTNLIPRVITFNGYNVLSTLVNDIRNILDYKRKPPQTRKQLEEFIRKSFNIVETKQKKKGVFTKLINNIKGKFKKENEEEQLQVKWVRSMKQPKKGTEIINKKLRIAFLKFAEPNGKMPFTIFISKGNLRKCGITTDIAENSYITVEGQYGPPTYYTIVTESHNSKKEIINKPIVLEKRTDYTKFDIIYTSDECAMWFREPGIDPRTGDIIYQDSPEYNMIFEQGILFNKKANPYNISTKGVVFKSKILKTIPEYYSIGDCLRWVRQPNKNPITGKFIIIDSDEYNRIFEKALLFDSNMQPLLITATGTKFKKAYLVKKRRLYGNEKVSNRLIRIDRGDRIYSDVCDAINNIYEGDKRYKYFKDRMLENCVKPHNACIAEIKASIQKKYKPFDYHIDNKVSFDFFADSAIASVIIFFNNIKDQLENPEYNDIFTNNYTKLYVSIFRVEEVKETEKTKGTYIITQTEARDAGGPAREFLTNFFEELFCDNENPTRPFIQPINNKEGRYYINPNFAPDDNFRKVIAAYKTTDSTFNLEFKTEKDYEDIYHKIGKVLSIAVVNDDIGIPKQFSTYIVTGLIKQPKDITLYELLYFHVCEFNNVIIYLNMIRDSQIEWVNDLGMDFNEYYVISKNNYTVSKENCSKFLLQLAKHIITKNFLEKEDKNSNKSMKSRYTKLFSGFDNKLRTMLAETKIGVVELERMITIIKLDEKVLKEFASKIIVEIRGKNSLPETEKKEKENEMKQILYEIITEKWKDKTDEEHHIFIQKLLRFWTALTQYNKTINYTISYQIGKDINGNDFNKNRFPDAHTCFNLIDIYGFPDEIVSYDNKKEFLYDRLYEAVFNTPGMDNE